PFDYGFYGSGFYGPRFYGYYGSGFGWRGRAFNHDGFRGGGGFRGRGISGGGGGVSGKAGATPRARFLLARAGRLRQRWLGRRRWPWRQWRFAPQPLTPEASTLRLPDIRHAASRRTATWFRCGRVVRDPGSTTCPPALPARAHRSSRCGRHCP